MMFWSVRFPAVCGYRVMQALVHPDELGRPLLKVWLGGSNNYAQWGVGDENNPADPPLTLDFERATAHAADWPRNITLEFLPARNVPAGAAASALLMDAPNCFCLSEPPVDFRLENILFDVGGLWSGTCCTGYPSTIPLAVYTPDDCYWVGDVPYPGGGCSGASQGATLYMGEQDPCLWWADIWLISFNGSNYSTAIFTHVFRLDEFSPDGPLTCPIDNIIDDGCTMNAGFVLNIYPAPPEVDVGAEGECELRNLPGCCRPIEIPPPNPNDPAQVLDIFCCPCLPPLPVPGPGGGCSGSDCAIGINPATGQVYQTVDNDFGGVNLTPNEPGAATAGAFGTNAMTLIEEHITTGSSSTEVHKCDGRVLVFACQNTSGSPITDGPWPLPVNEYIPIPPNNDRLFWTGVSWVLRQASDGARYHYGAGNKLALIQKKFGNVTQTWTISNNAVIEPSGLRTTYTFNGSGKVRRMTDPYGRITTFTVDGAGNLTQRITPELCTTQMRYDGSKRLVAQIDCYGNRTSLAYDGNSKVKRATTPAGGIYSYTYPAQGVTKIVEPGTAVTTVQYDRWGTIQKIINPAGQRTTYAYANQFRTVDVSPAGVRTSYTYQRLNDTSLRLRSTITPAGRVTNVYDSSSRLAAVVNALGGRTTYVYSGTAKLAEINPLGFRTSYVYNASGLLAATISPLSQRTTLLYNSLKQKSAQIDPLGNRTTFLYSSGMPLVTIDPLGRRTTTIYDASDRLIATIAPNGARTTNVYDAGQRKLATINPAGYRTSSVYDKNNLVAEIDPFSRRTTYAYDLRGNKKRTVDALSRITTTVYDTSNRPVAQITPLLARTTTVYNTKGQAAATINPLGFRTTNVYDSLGRNVASINPLGFRATTVYGTGGLVAAQVDQLGNRTTNVYDKSQRKIATIDPLLRRTTNVFDNAGRTVANIDPLSLRHTTVYDNANRGVAQITPLGFRSTTIYNNASQSVAQINPLGFRSTTVYNAAGQTLANIDARNYRTTTVYDTAGRVKAQVNAVGARTTSVFDKSRTVAQIDPLGFRTTSVFNALGQTTAQINAENKRTTTVYDSGNRPLASIAPMGQRVTTVYNIASQSIAQINPLGFRTTSVYDNAGRNVATVDAENHISTQVLDKTGRAIATVNALNLRTTMVYNAVGKNTALVNPLGYRTTYTYDLLDRQTQEIDPLGRRTTSVWDNDGRQTLRIDARTNRTTYVHDNADQLLTSSYPNGSRTTFAYDQTGNRTWKENVEILTTLAYDGLGQPLSVMQELDSVKHIVNYAYDQRGDRSRMIDPDGGRFTYSYDSLRQIETLENPQNDVTSYPYDDNGRRTVKRLANGTRASFTYDNATNILRVANLKDDLTTISSFDYRYDKVANRKAMIEADGSRVTYAYDNTYQLLAEHRTGTSGYRYTYTYDNAGNRNLSWQTGVENKRTTTVYDAADQIIYSIDGSGRTTYTFDADGNEARKVDPAGARTTTTWDYENKTRLIQLPTGIRNTMAWDTDGLRILLEESAGVKRFIHDGHPYLAETDQTNRITVCYTVEPTQYGRLISHRSNDETLYAHFDVLGSTREVTDESEATAQAIKYDAWGNIISQSGLVIVRMQYVGEYGYYYDIDTKLSVAGQRSYLPLIARWTAVDILAYSFQGELLYAYVMNRPLVGRDPAGLATFICNCVCRYPTSHVDAATRSKHHFTAATHAAAAAACAKTCEGFTDVPRRFCGIESFSPNFPTVGGPTKDNNTKFPSGLCCWPYESPSNKSDRLKPVPGIAPPPKPKPVYPGGGTSTWYGVPFNSAIGGGGALTCAILVVKCKEGAASFHFTAGDDVLATLRSGGGAFMRNTWEGCEAIMCGGFASTRKDDAEDVRQSSCLADDVLDAVADLGIKLVGVESGSECGFLPDGRWYAGS